MRTIALFKLTEKLNEFCKAIIALKWIDQWLSTKKFSLF